MPSSILFSYLSYSLITAFTPGPNNILSLNTTQKFGFKKSNMLILGICSGLFCVMCLCGILCMTLVQLDDSFINNMKYIGTVYILWLAWLVFKSKPVENSGCEKEPSFFTGFVLQFVNIKIILYGMVALSNFVMPYTDTVSYVCFFVLVMTLIGSMGTCTWAFAGSVFQDYLNRHYKIINLVMAAFLVQSAVQLLI